MLAGAGRDGGGEDTFMPSPDARRRGTVDCAMLRPPLRSSRTPSLRAPSPRRPSFRARSPRARSPRARSDGAGPRPVVLACSFALAFVLTAALGAPLPLPAQEPIPPADPAVEAALLRATNDDRASHGLASVAQDEGLARAARAHAAEMAQLNYFSHGSPVPAHDSLSKRLALAGSPLVDIAENIVMLPQPGTAQAAGSMAVDDWLHSPPHRKNLLNPTYDRVGFGAARNAQGELYVVQDFAYDPVRLLDATVAHTTRAVRRVSVRIRARSPTQALFHLGAAAPETRDLPAGTSTVTLTTDATGTVDLFAGIPLQGNHYVVDDGGTLDLASGRYVPDPGEPRSRLQVLDVGVRSETERGARLELRYAPPPSGTLALFLDGAFQATARVAAGRFAVFVPDTRGPTTLSVGLQGNGNDVSVLERFHVEPSAQDPHLLAGKAR